MARQPNPVAAPAWTVGASRRDAFRRGLIEAPSVAVIVVVITFFGFGALAHDVGLDVTQSLFITLTVFALPGQVVMADQIAHGAGLAATAFAVTLTAVRLLPLTFSLMPMLRDDNTPRWLEFLLCYIAAITVWIEAMRRLPPLPRGLRVPYYAGFALAMFVGVTCATWLGFVMAAEVPAAIAAGFVFLTPVYFFLSLIETAVSDADKASLILGSVLGPVLFLVLPGFDLFLTGLIGGTAAYAFMRLRRKAHDHD